MSTDGALLPAEQLKRYADAIVKAGVSLAPGDTLVVRGEHEHRELMVALAEAGYRAGAVSVDAIVHDPLVSRARLKYGRDDALGAITPWSARRLREEGKPTTAVVTIAGEATPGYLEGIPPARVRTDSVRAARHQAAYRRAMMQMRVPWAIAGWPTDHWAGLVYPELEPLAAKRKLARDLLWFCRLTDKDGRGSSGWMRHVRAIDRRASKLTRLGLDRLELRGPGTELDVRMAAGTRWMGGFETTPDGAKLTPNMPTEETFTSPHASGTDGTFACTFPLSFRGRLIRGLRGEFRNGWLVRLDADSRKDRDFVAAYLDGDKTGHGRRLGEVALVDATSRIGLSGRTFFHTLLDENASAHIAFGQGFTGARATKPARGLNHSIVHLDVMIGGPELEVTGVTSKGRRLPLIADGFWQI
jgi:aminopeptidase